MVFTTRRPAYHSVANKTLFATQIALTSSIGYALVILCATQPNNTFLQQAMFGIGPGAALMIAYFGLVFLNQTRISRLGGITGLLLGSSIGVLLTMWLGGVSFNIALQALGIAGGVASIAGMRFGWKAAIVTAILGGICATSGASMLPTMLEKGSWFAWLVNLAGSAAATFWLGLGIARVSSLENPVAFKDILKRLTEKPVKTETNLEPPEVKPTLHPTTPELTSKQLETLKLLIAGADDKTMAKALGLEVPGVRNRLKTLKQKFNVETRATLIAKAVQCGINDTTIKSDGG